MRKQIYAGLLTIIFYIAASGQIEPKTSQIIKGQVIDDLGQAVSGAVVYAHPDGGLRGKLPSATTDARGEFTIVVYQTGGYRITVSKPADGFPSTWNPFYYPTEDSMARVIVNENQATPFTTVRIGTKVGKITGRIADAETGRFVTGAHIDLCRAESPKYCHRVSAIRSDGQFEILVPSTPFTIHITAPGYKDWYGVDSEDRQPMSFEVASGATKTINVSLVKLSSRGDAVNPWLLKAPQLISPTNGAEFFHYPRTTKLEWSAVTGAASYTVELEFCNDREAKQCPDYLLQIRGNPPLSGIKDTSYEFLFIGTQAGRWRVWAVDEKGRIGAKSDWSIFVYKP